MARANGQVVYLFIFLTVDSNPMEKHLFSSFAYIFIQSVSPILIQMIDLGHGENSSKILKGLQPHHNIVLYCIYNIFEGVKSSQIPPSIAYKLGINKLYFFFALKSSK